MAVPSGDRSVADADNGPRPRALSPRMAALVQKIDAASTEQLVRFRAKAEQDAKDDRAQRAARRARWAGRPISKEGIGLGRPGLDKFHVHIRCYAAWEFERNKPPQ